MKSVAEIVQVPAGAGAAGVDDTEDRAVETVWSVPSSVLESDGLTGRFSETPAVPVTVAVVVSVPARAAVDCQRAAQAAIPR